MTRNVIKASQGYLMLIYGHALFFYSLVLTVEIKYYDLFIYFNFRLPIVCAAPEVQGPEKQKQKKESLGQYCRLATFLSIPR